MKRLQHHTWRDAQRRFKTRYWSAVLEQAHGNASAAARIAAVDRGEVYRYAKRLGIDLAAIRRRHGRNPVGRRFA